jgi:enediyne biosynthesis protein E4
MRWWLLGMMALLAAAERTVYFADATAESGLTFRNQNSATAQKYLIETMTGGVALLDWDGDGFLDVFLTNGAKLESPQKDGVVLDKSDPRFWNRLYRNVKGERFEDVTERAGVRGHGYSMGAAVADYDNDGRSDLLVTNLGEVILYRNDGQGRMVDVTRPAGLSGAEGWFTSAGFFDFDKDGHLDLFLCRYVKWSFGASPRCGEEGRAGLSYCHPDQFAPVSNLLFRNNGDGTFTDVSMSSGVGKVQGKALGVAFLDYDGDGFEDISVANDSFRQFLFRNRGDGTFEEKGVAAGVAYDEDGRTFAGMGTDAADIDGDGWPDIVTTTLSNETYAYFRNERDGSFTYATGSSGLGRITRLFAGWGVRVFDYDSDGARDVFFANGHVMDNIRMSQPHVTYEQPFLLLRWAGRGFVDVTASAGAALKEARAARGAAFGDLDNDGDVDIVVAACNGPAVFLRNEGGNRNGWIGFRLVGTRSNRDGMGAKIAVTTIEKQTQHYVVTSTASYQSAHDNRIFAGLGGSQGVAEVRVTWPSGVRQTLTGLEMRRVHVIEEPKGE